MDSASSLYQQGKSNQLQARYDLAIAQFSQFLRAYPNHSDALGRLAFCLQMKKRIPAALKMYRRALRFAPGNPDVLLGLASCYQSLGHFDKAVAHYKKSLRIEPEKIEALYNLVTIEGYALHAPVVKALERIHRCSAETSPGHVEACFALGKVYESNRQPEKAFLYYEEGNRLKFAQVAYNEKDWFAYFDAVESVFNAELLERLSAAGRNDITPIFIVGMARSGSTLVEQMLASHPAVHGADEVDIIPRIADNVIPQMTGRPYPDAVRAMRPEAFALLADLCLRELRGYCRDNKPRITDKTLRNYFHIGLIRILFPRAAIVHCVRDPMDMCWSIFRHHFSGNIPYCYDQTALGRFYGRYRRLMEHWHRVLPGAIHVIEYERLIHEPVETLRKLLNYCGLAFEKKCLAFYRTRRAVSTASSQQVRKPIYTSSMRSWEPVADRLAPLRAAIAEAQR